MRSESSGGGAPLLSAEGATRRADYQSRRPDEKGELLLCVCEESAKKFLTVNFGSVQNADTVKLLSATKQEQDDLLRAKRQVENELENLRQEKRNMVRCRQEQETASVDASVPDVSLAVRLLSHQVNQQQQEAQQLNQDLLQQKAEVTALRSSLENKEKVRLIHTRSGVLLVISVLILICCV